MPQVEVGATAHAVVLVEIVKFGALELDGGSIRVALAAQGRQGDPVIMCTA